MVASWEQTGRVLDRDATNGVYFLIETPTLEDSHRPVFLHWRLTAALVSHPKVFWMSLAYAPLCIHESESPLEPQTRLAFSLLLEAQCARLHPPPPPVHVPPTCLLPHPPAGHQPYCDQSLWATREGLRDVPCTSW